MQYSATQSLHCLFAQLTAVARLQNAAATTATTGIYLWKLEPAFQGLWLGMASRLEWSGVVSTLALHYRAHITPARIVMAGSMLDLQNKSPSRVCLGGCPTCTVQARLVRI